MKKALRICLICLGSLVALLLLAGGIAFVPAVQTWAARRVLAARPGVEVSFGRLAADLRAVRIEGLQARHDGAVLTLPAAEVRLALFDAAWHRRVAVTRLSAKGWTLDLTRNPAAAGSAAGAGATASAAALVFRGVFDQMQLPVDLALDGVDLEGWLLLPGPPGQAPVRTAVSLQGGGLSATREGRFTFVSRAEIKSPDAPVSLLEFHGTLDAAMDTPRTFGRLAAAFEARAAGPALPQPVQLTAEIGAARVRGGENYTLHLQSLGKRLVDLQANYPAASARLGGVWKLDLRDTDLAPFILGRPLPTFEAVGAGMFETDTGFKAVHAAGRLQSTAGRLAAVRSELEAVGTLGLFSEFDFTLHDGCLRIDRLTLNVSQAEPVLSVRSQQAFEFNPGTGELKVADPADDLLVINLHGVPVRWFAPLTGAYAVGGGLVRGELRAGAAAGGLMLHTTGPVRIDNFSLTEAGRPLVAPFGLAVEFTADYSPLGWQAELKELRADHGGDPWLRVSAKVGRLAGADQVIKATGHWSADLPGLLQQPLVRGAVALTRGRGQGEFNGSLGAGHRELLAGLRLTDLAVATGETLPLITAELRADTAADGQVAFNLPLTFENREKNRRSDLTLTGTLQSRPAGLHVEARVASREVFVEDVQVLAALTGVTAPATGGPARETAPFWHGLDGQLTLALAKLRYNEQFEVSDVEGTVRIEQGALRLDAVKAGLGEGGRASFNGGIRFEGTAERPYALKADLAVEAFNPRTLFLALRPGDPATVEGNFDITSRLCGRAGTLAGLVEAASGDLLLTSRGGVFRGLPLSVIQRAESTSRIAAGVAAVGSLLGSVGGKREFDDIANRAQAVTDLTKVLSAVAYDQLSVVLERDDTHAALLKDFTLISPELRFAGNGRIAAAPGVALLDRPLTMEFKVRARGQPARLLDYLGLLAPEPDELGYAAWNLPLRIGGTLAAPDTAELNRALAGLALEKSGAGNLLDRLLGGGK